LNAAGNNIENVAGNDYNIEATNGDVSITAPNGEITLRAGTNSGEVNLTDDAVNISSSNAANTAEVNVNTNNFNINADTTRVNGDIVLGSSDGSSTVSLPGLKGNNTGFVTADENGVLGRTGFSVDSVITNISDLGDSLRKVDTAIDSVGAMALAVSSIPNLTSGEKKYGCGIGTGVMGSSWAGAAGCVAKVSSDVWINAAITYSPGVSTGFYTTSSVGGRLGAFWQF
jgi:hypothetical protein